MGDSDLLVVGRSDDRPTGASLGLIEESVLLPRLGLPSSIRLASEVDGASIGATIGATTGCVIGGKAGAAIG